MQDLRKHTKTENEKWEAEEKANKEFKEKAHRERMREEEKKKRIEKEKREANLRMLFDREEQIPWKSNQVFILKTDRIWIQGSTLKEVIDRTNNETKYKRYSEADPESHEAAWKIGIKKRVPRRMQHDHNKTTRQESPGSHTRQSSSVLETQSSLSNRNQNYTHTNRHGRQNHIHTNQHEERHI
jgi:hypothetical protein